MESTDLPSQPLLSLETLAAEDDLLPGGVITALINTYYDVSLDPTQGTAVDGNVESDYNNYLTDVINGAVTDPLWSTTRFTGNAYEPQYRLSIPWVIVDLISCKILLAASIFALWLRKHTLAPDIFGYVSSLTRDNPHPNLPDGGSTLSCLDRSRILKNMKVEIADVADESGVAKLGLRYAGADFNMQMAHLKRDRHYV